MSEVKIRSAGAAPGDAPAESLPAQALTRLDVITAYRVAELVTLARDGSPVCWPVAPDIEHGRLTFSTGYMYPVKARNAQRNPRVAVLYSDPTASGRSEADPCVLVQGLAEVLDQDLQRNVERYVDQLSRKGPLYFRLVLRVHALRQLLVGYLARIWIEVTPRQEHIWAREQPLPEPLRTALRPAAFKPGPGIELPAALFHWLPRYPRRPVLAYIDANGWPAVARVAASLEHDAIAIGAGPEAREGAPACLTYHRLVGNYTGNDSFLIRGHFDAAGRLIPEKLVGYAGSRDDRGLGSIKLMRMLIGFRSELARTLAKEGRALPVARPTPRG